MTLSWADLAAMTMVGSAVAGALFWVLRGRLGAFFVSRAEYNVAMQRLDDVERMLKSSPTHDDFRKLAENVALSSRDLAVVAERLSGMKEGVSRIERELGLFVQARLEWEKQQ